jgi:hypothetical protein
MEPGTMLVLIGTSSERGNQAVARGLRSMMQSGDEEAVQAERSREK